ncbi:hypothetical protein ACFVHB_34895 [Kitasatospora sp. NPDC127111]
MEDTARPRYRADDVIEETARPERRLLVVAVVKGSPWCAIST